APGDDRNAERGAKPSALDARECHESLGHGDRNRRCRVVGLADEEEEDEWDRTGNPDWAKQRTTKERNHARDPERKKKRNIEAELDEVNPDATPRALVVGDIREGGEAVDHLPGEVWRPDEQCDRGGDPRVSRAQLLPERRCEEDGDGDAGNEPHDRVLHLEADPEADAQIDPVP